MYSIVLMMAMTSGGNVADFGHRHGCCGGEVYAGCCGGSVYSGCCGGYVAYSGCCGGESYGCCGGGHHHRLFGRRHHGGCCGGESYGCCGGAPVYSGCCGGAPVVADCGCGAPVYSGCTGGVVTGGAVTGENAEPIKAGHTEEHIKKGEENVKPAAMTAEENSHMEALIKAHPDKKADIEKYLKNATPAERAKYWDENKPAQKKDGEKKEDGKEKTMISAPATIIVSLPSDAKLTIDDAATTSTASPRVFTSPVLPAGQDFHYTLKAEMVRNGKPVVVSKQVTVRAGQATRVNLEAGLTSVASR